MNALAGRTQTVHADHKMSRMQRSLMKQVCSIADSGGAPRRRISMGYCNMRAKHPAYDKVCGGTSLAFPRRACLRHRDRKSAQGLLYYSSTAAEYMMGTGVVSAP